MHFAVTPLNTLFDSPLFAGMYSKSVDLDTAGKAPVRLNIFADSPDELVFSSSSSPRTASWCWKPARCSVHGISITTIS